MFYRFNPFSGRIGHSNAQAAYSPQGFNKAPEIRPSPSMPSAGKTVSGGGGGGGGSGGGFGLVNRVNRVPLLQSLFQGADSVVPVYLRGGRRDVLIYQSLMVLSVVGVAFTLQQLFMAAAGKMKKL